MIGTMLSIREVEMLRALLGAIALAIVTAPASAQSLEQPIYMRPYSKECVGTLKLKSRDLSAERQRPYGRTKWCDRRTAIR